MEHTGLTIDNAVAMQASPATAGRADACVLIDGIIYALAIWYEDELTGGHWGGYVCIPAEYYDGRIRSLGAEDITYVGRSTNRIQWKGRNSDDKLVPLSITEGGNDFWIGFDTAYAAMHGHQPDAQTFIRDRLNVFARGAYEVFVAGR